MTEAKTTDNVLKDDIELLYSTNVLFFNRVCLTLDRQLPMTEAAITDSVPGDGIELLHPIECVYCYKGSV
jgi:hypothetical protein